MCYLLCCVIPIFTCSHIINHSLRVRVTGSYIVHGAGDSSSSSISSIKAAMTSLSSVIASDNSPLAASIQAEPQDPLPAGWRSRNDPRTSRMYYFHTKTLETTWIRPRAATRVSGSCSVFVFVHSLSSQLTFCSNA